MNIDSPTIYKLMILYMLNKLDCQLTNAQLSGFFIENNYSEYYSIQGALSDLVTSGFIEKNVMRNTSYYSITPEGYTTLTFFKKQIPQSAIEDINAYLEANKYTLKNEVGVRADYYKQMNGDFIAHLSVHEGKNLLYDINLALPSEDEARKICLNFREYSQDIYNYLVKNLLQ